MEERFKVPSLYDPRYMEANLLSAFQKPYLPVITQNHPEQIRFLRWGLIPAWVKDRETAMKISNSTFNARAESIFEKPSFRAAANYKRSLVLVHGFFEWHHKSSGDKIPYYIKRKDNRPFAFAGLSEDWTDKESGEIIESLSIITTRANPLMEKVHNSKKRMPVILDERNEKDWINPVLKRKELETILKPSDEKELLAYPVNKAVFQRPEDLLDQRLVEEIKQDENPNLFNT